MVVVSYCRSKCPSAFFGILYVYLLFECAVSTSANKARSNGKNVVYVQAITENKSTYDKDHQLHVRRQRRKLHTDTNDQLNSLDGDNGIQYQEYQGVFGRPGVDFPVLARIPVTKFNCRNVKNSNNGYYADMETNCQVFHVCDGGRKISFLCPNGTIFRQSHLICDWWFRVDCERSPELYEQSVKHLESDQTRFRQRAEAISNTMQNAIQKGISDSTLLESPVSVVSRPNNDFNSESNLPQGNQHRQRLQPKPDDSQSFDHGSNPNFGADLPPPRSFNSGTAQLLHSKPDTSQSFDSGSNHNFGSSLPPPRSFSSSTMSTKTTNTNFNRQNYATQPTRVKFASNTNLNPPPPPKTSFDTLILQPSRFNDGFDNNFKTEFGLPPKTNFNNQDFSSGNLGDDFSVVYNPTFQPRVKPTSTESFGKPNFNQYSNSQPQNAFPVTRTRFNPLTPSRSTPVIATPLSNTRFSTTFRSTSPLQTSFAVTTPTWSNADTVSPPKVTFPVTASPRPGGGDRFTQTQSFAQLTASPETTPLSNDFHEHQILAETAAFAGNGKHSSFQEFYYPQNFIQSNNDFTKFSGTVSSTESTGSTPNLNEQYRTTFYPENEIVDTRTQNSTNETYALYYPSGNNDIFNLPPTVPNEVLISPVQRNTTKPAVSEFLLKSSPPSEQFTSKSPEQPVDPTIPVLLTNHTKEAYQQLFPKAAEQNATNELAGSDLQSEHSSGLVQSSSPKSSSSSPSTENQKSAPDFRELAQIFSRALSAYLEDPEQFRKILSEVRPTEPPPLDSLKSEAANDDEVLAFSEDNERSTLRSPTTVSSSTIDLGTSTRGIKNPETFAEEINNFMFSEQSFHGADSAEFNVNETYYPNGFFDPSNVTTDVTFTVSPLIDFTVNRSNTFPTTLSDIVPTTLPVFESAPQKGNLYDESDSNEFASEANPQSLSDEQLLITADTQSFLARDNLVKLQQQRAKYNDYVPVLKTPAYPQFGRRTSTITRTPFITSRSDFVETTASSRSVSYTPYAVQTNVYSPETRFPFTNTDLPSTTDPDDFLTTLSNLATAETPTSSFNRSAVQAMVNMMEEAKSNPTLRRKLVLLLVNDKSVPENKSVKSMKSRLLRALLVPPSSTSGYESYTEPQLAESRHTYSVETAPTGQSFRTPPSTTPGHVAGDRPKENAISRGERATFSPSSSTGAKPECSNGLSDADTRAVDLLKTLYSIASNNWKQ